MSLIKDAIDTIAKLAEARKARVEFVDIPGEKLAVDQTTGELATIYETPPTRTAKLGDLLSLRAWCEAEPGAEGEIVIGRTGHTSAESPAKALDHQRSRAQVDFFDAFIPKQPMKLGGFIAWLDLIRPGIAPADAEQIDACMRAVTVAEGSSATVTQTGASISVKAESGKGLSTERPFPKRFAAVIPFGDPSFVTRVGFSATLAVHGSELIATIAVDELELAADGTATGPRARFVAWARDLLAELPGWTVMAGA